MKFKGNYQELQDKVLLSGIVGNWKEIGDNQKQYKTEDGAILNWWQSSKTLNFQGPKEEKEQFETAFNNAEVVGKGGVKAPARARRAKPKTKIFIVHGHDHTALEQLELVLRRLDLNPYILQNNDGESKTLIEALEGQIYKEAAFGIILMTPDDFGYVKTQSDEDRQPRARQNVIMEMGMVMASLGREKMVILKKGNLELPSDVNGVIYLNFNEHVKEIAVKLASRMKGSGIEISDALIASASA